MTGPIVKCSATLKENETRRGSRTLTNTRDVTVLESSDKRVKMKRVIYGAEEEVAPARSHMMPKTGSDTNKHFSDVCLCG